MENGWEKNELGEFLMAGLTTQFLILIAMANNGKKYEGVFFGKWRL